MRRSASALFDPESFLTKSGGGRRTFECRKKTLIFSQGEQSDCIFYLQSGRVKLTVVNGSGKQATIAILTPGHFLGEECLIDRPVRGATAVAVADCLLTRIHKATMIRALHDEPALSELFISFLISRQLRTEGDLIDQLFNSSEKRLARLLLLMSNINLGGDAGSVIPKISQETLAEMVGTTRSRVSSFMNKFRKLGYLEYGQDLRVHSSLQNVFSGD